MANTKDKQFPLTNDLAKTYFKEKIILGDLYHLACLNRILFKKCRTHCKKKLIKIVT